MDDAFTVHPGLEFFDERFVNTDHPGFLSLADDVDLSEVKLYVLWFEIA